MDAGILILPLQVIDVDVPASVPSEGSIPVLSFDPEWLAITRAFNQHMTLNRVQSSYPDEDPAREAVRRELEWIKEHVVSGKEGGTVKVDDVQQFVMTAPGPGSEGGDMKAQRKFSPPCPRHNSEGADR